MSYPEGLELLASCPASGCTGWEREPMLDSNENRPTLRKIRRTAVAGVAEVTSGTTLATHIQVAAEAVSRGFCRSRAWIRALTESW